MWRPMREQHTHTHTHFHLLHWQHFVVSAYQLLVLAVLKRSDENRSIQLSVDTTKKRCVWMCDQTHGTSLSVFAPCWFCSVNILSKRWGYCCWNTRPPLLCGLSCSSCSLLLQAAASPKAATSKGASHLLSFWTFTRGLTFFFFLSRMRPDRHEKHSAFYESRINYCISEVWDFLYCRYLSLTPSGLQAFYRWHK